MPPAADARAGAGAGAGALRVIESALSRLSALVTRSLEAATPTWHYGRL